MDIWAILYEQCLTSINMHEEDVENAEDDADEWV
jgi:hypothetical protein